MSRAVRIVKYTETIERSFRLNVGEDDASKVIPKLRDGTMTYVYDDDDRSKGAVVNDCGQTIALTTEDYGLVMRRGNFRSEVEWPDSGFLCWLKKNENLHTWFTKGLLFCGLIFVFGMMLFGHKEYSDARGVLLLVVMAIPMVIHGMIFMYISLKRSWLGA